MWTGTATRVTVASGEVNDDLSPAACNPDPSPGSPVVAAADDAAFADAAAWTSAGLATQARKHAISRSPANSSFPNRMQARQFLSTAVGLSLGTSTRSWVQRYSTSAEESFAFTRGRADSSDKVCVSCRPQFIYNSICPIGKFHEINPI